jgi:hypothetical protein
VSNATDVPITPVARRSLAATMTRDGESYLPRE